MRALPCEGRGPGFESSQARQCRDECQRQNLKVQNGYRNGVRRLDKSLLDEVIACLPEDRTVFRYARDDYALMLLSRVTGDGVPVGELRRSAYGRLLNKPSVEKLLANRGDGVLSRSLFDYAWVEGRQDFLLTLGRWNEAGRGYNQTTRHSGNLVLQINFTASHDREFEELIGPSGKDDFASHGHPVLQAGDRRYYRHTMAWVRMDIDFETAEVLIEEVQTDWLRDAEWYLWNVERCLKHDRKRLYELVLKGKVKAARRYVKDTLAMYARLWDEAALTAAINFAVDELGIGCIYYHSFETGNVLKKIRYSHPPRSLYTDLPRKFCFRLTDEAPAMLYNSGVARRKLKKVKQPRWYRLVLQE